VSTVNVVSPEGEPLARTVDLPDEIFGVQVNVPLIHQVVVAQLAAARQGTAKAKTRGEVSGGGKKPYRQKGTGRARQGSIRAPQFTGGGVVHGPVPRDYSQRTPKKMKAAALRGALSDRARGGRVHVVSSLVPGDAPSTKAAVRALVSITERQHVLVVVDRADALTWKSLRNVERVHLLRPDQLNTYDVLVADEVVFTEDALAAFLAAAPSGRGGLAAAGGASDSPATSTDTLVGAPATDAGTTEPAGAGLSDEQAVAEVERTTDSNRIAETAYAEAGADVPSAQDVERGNDA
jgi:large subunit ribosomal protein L4